jgi:hypothetical protein
MSVHGRSAHRAGFLRQFNMPFLHDSIALIPALYPLETAQPECNRREAE